MMSVRIITVLLTLALIAIGTHAEPVNFQMGKELHRSLLEQERPSLSNLLADTVIRARPNYKPHRDVIIKFLGELAESEEFEQIRSTYFATTFSEQELRTLIVLVRSAEFRLYQRAMNGLAERSSQQLTGMVARRAEELNRRVADAERAAKGDRGEPKDIHNFSFKTRDWIEERLTDLEANVTVRLVTPQAFSVQYTFNIPLMSVDATGIAIFNMCLARYLSTKKGHTQWAMGGAKGTTLTGDGNTVNYFVAVLNDGETPERASVAGDILWTDPSPNDDRAGLSCNDNLRPAFRTTQGK